MPDLLYFYCIFSLKNFDPYDHHAACCVALTSFSSVEKVRMPPSKTVLQNTQIYMGFYSLTKALKFTELNPSAIKDEILGHPGRKSGFKVIFNRKYPLPNTKYQVSSHVMLIFTFP